MERYSLDPPFSAVIKGALKVSREGNIEFEKAVVTCDIISRNRWYIVQDKKTRKVQLHPLDREKLIDFEDSDV